MGADGHIGIIKRSETLEIFPKADKYINKLPNAYIHELNGEKYYHCYWGDNMDCHFQDPDDFYIYKDDPPELKDELTKFVKWFWNNMTRWEVWT